MSDTKHGTEPFDIPGEANAEQGHVVLDGPDGVAITMTPAAAEGTAQNLIEAARKARETTA
jgi:hypothetical protein